MSAVLAGGSPENRRRRSRAVDGDRPDDDSVVRIKVEPDVDIKDYAETTMNELLGWYGYDKLDTRGLNLKNLNHHFPTSSSSSSPLRHEEDLSEDDTGRSRSPQESIAPNTTGGPIVCAWCLKTGMKLFTLKTSSGETKVFCSEPCFNQCRRAAFKKNRVCNWCRHVRHTVNYVDFQDGDDQLQFCSDKCLNQYKMQIFCKETQAYLQMNPHLQEETKNNAGGSSKLITPDLWLRDCQESLNGGGPSGLPHSDDEVTASSITANSGKNKNGDELEDLSLHNKSERCISSDSNATSIMEREIGKLSDVPQSIKDKRATDMCNTLASYLRDEKEKNFLERKKRFHESEKEHARKRQRISSVRNKINHHPEAPPAHHSAAHSPLSFQNQNRVFSSSSPYPPPLSAGSPAPLNPPAAHSNSLPPHPAINNTLLPPGLPPPPPLLNNDFLHSSFNPSMFPPPLNTLSQQQQLDAILRMQSGMRHPTPFPQQLLYESMLPLLRNAVHPSANPFLQPNTVMLPYPIFVPLPVPIPIPMPLSSFLTKEQRSNIFNKDKAKESSAAADKDCIPLDSDNENQAGNVKVKNSKNSPEEVSNDIVSEKQTHTADSAPYAVTSDGQTNKLILTRSKMK